MPACKCVKSVMLPQLPVGKVIVCVRHKIKSHLAASHRSDRCFEKRKKSAQEASRLHAFCYKVALDISDENIMDQSHVYEPVATPGSQPVPSFRDDNVKMLRVCDIHATDILAGSVPVEAAPVSLGMVPASGVDLAWDGADGSGSSSSQLISSGDESGEALMVPSPPWSQQPPVTIAAGDALQDFLDWMADFSAQQLQSPSQPAAQEAGIPAADLDRLIEFTYG